MSSKDHFLNEKQTKKLDREIQKTIDRLGLDRKTEDEVFDKSTLLTIEKLISNKIISYIDFPISTGKEGNIFLGYDHNKTPIAIKIYRISTATFKHITHYLLGDPRFQSIHKSRRDIVYAWTSKEYKNLKLLQDIQVTAPRPIKKLHNVLIMQYIGSEYRPAPLLKDVQLKTPQRTYQQIMDSIEKMYTHAHLVHSDLSSFNILMHQNKPYIIDLGQGVLLDHPKAYEFLKRDIHNIVSYFKKYNIREDENSIFTRITEESDIS